METGAVVLLYFDGKSGKFLGKRRHGDGVPCAGARDLWH